MVPGVASGCGTRRDHVRSPVLQAVGVALSGILGLPVGVVLDGIM